MRDVSSAFYNQVDAEKWITKVIKQNEQKIKELLENEKMSSLRLEETFNEIVGRGFLEKDRTTPVFTNRVTVTLIKDKKMPDGYRIETAFPSIGRSQQK